MNTKNNQRYRDMDHKMKTVLLHLLQTRDFEKITVREICEEAGVNRSTFYAHYQDIFEMMEQMEDHLNEELVERYKATDLDPQGALSEETLLPLLSHIRDHQYFYRVVMPYRRNNPERMTANPIWRLLMDPALKRAGIVSEEEQNYYRIYFQSGSMMVIKHWIETGCTTSEDEMARLLCSCVPEVFSENNGSHEKRLPEKSESRVL